MESFRSKVREKYVLCPYEWVDYVPYRQFVSPNYPIAKKKNRLRIPEFDIRTPSSIFWGMRIYFPYADL